MSEASAKQCQTLFSFIHLGTGVAMLVVGESNRDPRDCANGASEYLDYGGIATISANVAGILAGFARQAALKVS